MQCLAPDNLDFVLIITFSDSLLCSFHRYPGTVTKVLNLGSYNYLGFAETSGPCIDDVVQRINDDGVAGCSYRKDLGISFDLWW